MYCSSIIYLCKCPFMKYLIVSKVTLVQSGDHILNTYDEQISMFTEKNFKKEDNNVSVLMGTRYSVVINHVPANKCKCMFINYIVIICIPLHAYMCTCTCISVASAYMCMYVCTVFKQSC